MKYTLTITGGQHTVSYVRNHPSIETAKAQAEDALTMAGKNATAVIANRNGLVIMSKTT